MLQGCLQGSASRGRFAGVRAGARTVGIGEDAGVEAVPQVVCVMSDEELSHCSHRLPLSTHRETTPGRSHPPGNGYYSADNSCTSSILNRRSCSRSLRLRIQCLPTQCPRNQRIVMSRENSVSLVWSRCAVQVKARGGKTRNGRPYQMVFFAFEEKLSYGGASPKYSSKNERLVCEN